MIEPELYESVKVFKELFDNMGSGVVIYEAKDEGNNFIIKELNESGLALIQVKKKDIIGKNVLEVFPSIKDFGLFEVLQKVWRTSIPERFPTAFYKDDRISGWTENYVYKIPSGKIVVIFEEKTEYIEAEENLKKRIEFETTISSISSKFVNPVDIDEAINSSLKNIGIISQASRSYLFLFNEDNITMSNTHEWCDEGVKPQLKELQNIPMASFQWSINKLKNSEILNIENVEDLPPEALAEKEEFLRENIKSLIFLPLKIGEELAGFIGFDNIRAPEKWREEDLNLLNVSSEIIGNALKRNRTEQELEELNKELQKRVKERTINLKESEEKYRKAYYQANLYRDIFAHDINNILQNISSSVELSSLYLHDPEKLGTIKELYNIIDEQVNRAKKLILNVRKITELDESEIILEKMDANRVLKNAIEFLQSSFQKRNININLNTPTERNYVYANKLLLDVFENILINAVRHNNKSIIEITIDISKEEKGDKKYVKMEFKDNGIGISDYRKKSIFERGTQKIQRSRGMGLGLSLVKKILDIYHGDIWVEDRIPGDYKQGSNFIILIPTND